MSEAEALAALLYSDEHREAIDAQEEDENRLFDDIKRRHDNRVS